jgi:hypothetical protein
MLRQVAYLEWLGSYAKALKEGSTLVAFRQNKPYQPKALHV